MKVNVFYSWQSDLPKKYNRNFIEECLEKAIDAHGKDNFELECSLDKDTKDVPGTPDIVATIFNKISNCHVFVADISIINSESQSRKCPNPNVLLELGFAAATIGWENIICVYNNDYGEIEELPFDLKFRRPLAYSLRESSSDNKPSVKKNLVSVFEDALKKADPEKTHQRRETKRAFVNESELALRIALEEPRFWPFKLMEELLRSKLKMINEKYADFESGVVYRKTKYLELLEFTQFMIDAWTNFERIHNVLGNAIMRFAQSQQEEAIEMKKSTDKLYAVMNDLLEWEMEMENIAVDDECEEVKQLGLGNVKVVMDELNRIPNELRRAYADTVASNEIDIHITIPEIKNKEEMVEKIRNLTKTKYSVG